MLDSTQPNDQAELVVVTRSVGQPAGSEPTPAVAGVSQPTLEEVVAESGLRLTPIFGENADEGASAAAVADLAVAPGRWYVSTGAASDLEPLAARLLERDDVEAAYVKPPAELAVVVEANPEPTLAEAAEEAPVSGNFVLGQGYLLPAPIGVDAPFAWARSGGRGDGVRVIDCEWGWQFDHEDLLQYQLGLVGGTNDTRTRFINHGTAVFGEIGGDHNAFGVNGIAPHARLGASSVNGVGSAGSIVAAANALSAGDLLLIEIHRSGPNDHTEGSSQQGYIAIEWWPDDLAAIRYAVARGVIVVEAAGNGWEDLDDPVYDQRPTGFPGSWRNPFNRSNPTSGAVVVGAGSPPDGTHGRSTDPWGQPYVNLARCPFSNWGSRVDAQGWGWEVTTTGYGNLAGSTPQTIYTETFSGTSSASPIVLGALAATQGALRAAGMALLTPGRARSLLRSTGTPQEPAPGRPVSQRIGNRPDLRELIPAALRQTVLTTVTHTYGEYGSRRAWARLQDYGWRRIATTSSDGVTNVLAACVDAQLTGTTVQADIDDETLYYAVLR